MSNRFGAFLGFLLPPYIIEADTTRKQTIMTNFSYFYLIIAILSAISCCLSMFGKFFNYYLGINFFIKISIAVPSLTVTTSIVKIIFFTFLRLGKI